MTNQDKNLDREGGENDNAKSSEVLGTCNTCNGNGVLGWGPDDYFNCPECSTATPVPQAPSEQQASAAPIPLGVSVYRDTQGNLCSSYPQGKRIIEPAPTDTGAAGAGEGMPMPPLPGTLLACESMPTEPAYTSAQMHKYAQDYAAAQLDWLREEAADLRAQLARQRQDSAPTDLSKRLREYARGCAFKDAELLMTQAADEIAANPASVQREKDGGDHA